MITIGPASVTDLLRPQLQDTLGEAYTLERELGGGGMSRVFVAHERSLGRRVVVKVLPPELSAEVSSERFRREILLAAQLQHPHIVPLLSAGESRGLPFFTMPYVEGESLRTRLTRSGEFPIAQAVRILREVAAALSHAHERGVVHRDVKPDNVLLTGDSAMVTDFGVAKALSAAQRPHGVGDAGVLTSHGIALGTPAYMAPEQAAADPAMDHRVDIYAFGVLAYELLTGQPPFAGRAPQALLAAHVAERPEPVGRRRASVPPPLAALVMRCLEKQASDRPQSAAELVHLLDAIATPSGGLTPARGSFGFRLPPRARRVAGAVVVLIAALAAGFAVHRGARSARAEVRADRVYVAPFVNRTLSPELAEAGPMAADLLARGLTETGLLDVVDDSATAGMVVRGTIYRRGDTLQLLAQVVDARTGRMLRSIGPLPATRDDPIAGLDTLRERVTGAVAALLDPVFGGVAAVTSAPPSYEAYRAVREGREAEAELEDVTAIGHYLRAAALGGTYQFPLVAAAEAYARLGECAAADSLGGLLLERRERLTPYEAYSVEETLAGCRGDPEGAYRAAARRTQIVPRSPLARYGLARAALDAGRWAEAREILDGLAEDPAAAGLRDRVDFVTTRASALHAAGAHEEELALARRAAGRSAMGAEWRRIEVRALAALGRARDLRASLDAVPAGEADLALEQAVDELRAHGHAREAAQLASALVDSRLAAARAGGSLGTAAALVRAYDAAAREPEARRLADSLARAHPGSELAQTLLGRVAAGQGDRAAAAAVENALVRDAAAAPGRGDVPHALARARIAALLGDREEAVTLLTAAIGQGEATRLRVREDPDFAGLRGYEPFDRMTRG